MEYLPALALAVTIIGAVWGHAIWLSNRFMQINNSMGLILDKISEKLEYHEQHDDKRFSEITNGLWEIRLQNARNGIKTLPRTGREKEEGGE